MITRMTYGNLHTQDALTKTEVTVSQETLEFQILALTLCILINFPIQIKALESNSIFFDFSLTVKAAPHECVIRTGQP